MAAIVFLLSQGPKTVKQLLHVAGWPAHGSNHTRLTRALRALEAEGLLSRKRLPPGSGGKGGPYIYTLHLRFIPPQ